MSSELTLTSGSNTPVYFWWDPNKMKLEQDFSKKGMFLLHPMVGVTSMCTTPTEGEDEPVEGRMKKNDQWCKVWRWLF